MAQVGKYASYEDFKKYIAQMKIPDLQCENHEIGKLINTKTGMLHYLRCKTRNCPMCYAIKRWYLYNETVKNVLIFNLQKHFIVTSPGKQFRSRHTWEQSYPIMAHNWNKFLQVIKYNLTYYTKIVNNRKTRFKYDNPKPLDYMAFPRAQQDGFCHYHILLNQYIPWDFLNEKRQKYDMGFVSIQENKDVAEYLNNDFLKESEWYIPQNVPNYSTSRSIIVNNYKPNPDIKYIDFIFQDNDQLLKQHIEQTYHITPDLPAYYERIKMDDLKRDYFKKWFSLYQNARKQGINYHGAKAIADELTGWCA